jgi:hypothetical protein
MKASRLMRGQGVSIYETRPCYYAVQVTLLAVSLHTPSMNNVHEQRPTSGPSNGDEPTTGILTMFGRSTKIVSYSTGYEYVSMFEGVREISSGKKYDDVYGRS